MSTVRSNAKLCAQVVCKVSSWCFHTCPTSTAAALEQCRCMWSALARWWMSSAPSSAQRSSSSMVMTSSKPCTAALHSGAMPLSALALKPYCLMLVSAVDLGPNFHPVASQALPIMKSNPIFLVMHCPCALHFVTVAVWMASCEI